MASNQRRWVPLRRVCLAATASLSLAFLGCGGGGSDGGGGPASVGELTLVNGLLTFGGQTNTMTITGYRLTNTSTLQVFTAASLDIQPGLSLQISVPVGTYNTVATYSDGDHERAQSPGDPVAVPDQSPSSLIFIR
jgi:hypothetical protein